MRAESRAVLFSPGTARLRFSLTADHSEADLERVAEVVGEAAHAALGAAR